MGHGIGVPAFAQHGHRYDAAYRVAEPSRLPDGVHDLPEQILVAQLLGLAAVAGTLDDVLAEAFDLRTGCLAEVPVEGLSGFELLAVDQEGPGAREGAAVEVEIPKQRQTAVLDDSGAVLPLPVEAGDVVVHQLGGCGVVADDDEAGRYGESRLLPQPVGFLIVAVEGIQRGAKLGRQVRRIESAPLFAAMPGHSGANVLPQLPVHRHLVAGHVVGHGNPR